MSGARRLLAEGVSTKEAVNKSKIASDDYVIV